MRARLLRASVFSAPAVAPAAVASVFSAPSVAPAAVASVAGAAGGVVGLGYGIAVAIGVLIFISTVMLASYLCLRSKARAAGLLILADVPAPSPAVVVVGLDSPAIDVLYPKFSLHAAGSHGARGDGEGAAAAGPCAICLGEFAAGTALRRGPGCGHCFHAGCAERWLRVSATCPLCRDSPVPSPIATPLAEAVPLAAHAR